MFDISEILNGKKSKKKKDNLNKLMLGINPKPLKNNLLNTRFIIGDRKTKQQKKFLMNTKGLNTKRFIDSDKDGVINALDCQYKNKKRHGIREYQEYLNKKKVYIDPELEQKEQRRVVKFFKRTPELIEDARETGYTTFRKEKERHPDFNRKWGQYESRGITFTGQDESGKDTRYVAINLELANRKRKDIFGTMVHETGHAKDHREMGDEAYEKLLDESHEMERKDMPHHETPIERKANEYRDRFIKRYSGEDKQEDDDI